MFVLARKHSSDPGATDASTILQAMSVKRYVELVSGGRNNIRTCMQVRVRDAERRRLQVAFLNIFPGTARLF